MHIHPLWLAEHVTIGHRKHFEDMAKLNCAPYRSRSLLVYIVIIVKLYTNWLIIFTTVSSARTLGNYFGQRRLICPTLMSVHISRQLVRI